MSSTNSRYYYHSPSRGQHGQNLPSLRSVLGDQLDLPFTHPSYQSPYDLGDIYKALPRASGDFSDSRNATPTHSPHADLRHSPDHSRSHRPYTYPPFSARAKHQMNSMNPTNDSHPTSCSPPHSSSSASKSGASRKYACTWEGCEKRFERQHALDTHMNIHLEQKPFACPVPHCGKGFNVRSNMRRHLLTHKDVQTDSQSMHEDDGEDDVQTNGRFHSSRHDHNNPASDTHRRSSKNPHTTAPAQRYYSPAHRI